jgi:hypothetical protein
MKRYKRHRLWIMGIVVLTFFSFLAGTSLACFQKGTGHLKMAEDCCKRHCQHVMAADMAAKCCQSHQVKVSQALPASSSPQAASLVGHALYVSLPLPVILQGPEQSRMHRSTEERPPPFLPLYAFHCTFLI